MAGVGSAPAKKATGRLHVVATPIGNLSDITQRAVEVLKTTRVVACENTRRSRVLFAKIGAAPEVVIALHDHNEAAASAKIIEHLLGGDDAALVTDAGTPLVSDPGFELVQMAWQKDIQVTPVPGACALVAAIAASPIATNRFRFEGFLPPKAKARLATLRRLLASDVPVIFYEAPHRLRETLLALVELDAAERPMVLCRELTKRFETIRFATVKALLEDDTVLDRGEFVCVLSAATTAPAAAPEDVVIRELTAELPAGQAARLAAKITGQPRRTLFEKAVSLRANTE